MPMTQAKQIVLGVTGSIAAYKAADLASQLTRHGCRVRVVMTADALRFITPLPFKTLSRHPVVTDLYDEEEGWKPTHIQLADEADLLLIAPATANTIAKLALGLANDALSGVALALNPRAKILIAPAMNGKMWLHPATQQNVALLKSRGAEFIGPEEGLLSCGYEGLGRLWPVEQVAAHALEMLGLTPGTADQAPQTPVNTPHPEKRQQAAAPQRGGKRPHSKP
jgi:phosphopantothenoylcysteine decarboxylase